MGSLEAVNAINVKLAILVIQYTVSRKSDVKPIATKRLALQLYLEGLGFRAIGRILQISYGTVYQWIKAWGNQVSLTTSQQAVEIVEIDELHTYIGSKKVLLGMDCC